MAEIINFKTEKKRIYKKLDDEIKKSDWYIAEQLKFQRWLGFIKLISLVNVVLGVIVYLSIAL